MKYKYIYFNKYINFYKYFNKYLNIFKYTRKVKNNNNKFNSINNFILIITY